MKVAIIEPHLIDFTGHFYSFVSELKKGFEGIGEEVEVFLPENSEVQNLGEKVLPPTFFPKEGRFKTYSRVMQSIFKFSVILKKIQKNFDALVFTTADNNCAIGGAALINTNKPLIFYFHTPEPLFYPMRKSLRFFLLLNKFKRTKIAFLTPAWFEEHLKKGNLLKHIKLFQDVPYPLAPPNNNDIKKVDKGFFLGYLGDAREDKNFRKVVELLSVAPENLGFIIQCNPPAIGEYEVGIKEIVQYLKGLRREHLYIYDNPLNLDEYQKILNLSSIVWCLYNASQYRNRISGILLEAWLFRKPVITTRGTWMARQVEKYGGGLVLDSQDPQKILKAVEEIQKNYERFSKEAEAAGKALFSKNNGVALATFIKRLLDEEVGIRADLL